MSKTIAIRVSDDIYSALEAQCQATGKTMTQLVTPIILGAIELPAAPLSPIEQRLAELETQMSEVANRLDAIDRDKTPPLDTGLEPVAIDRKISCESSRDPSEAGISTSEFTQYVEPLLRAYSSGGYYFRLDWLEQSELEQPGLKLTLQKQAKQLGFSSDSARIDGKKIRVWLNRAYRLQSADT